MDKTDTLRPIIDGTPVEQLELDEIIAKLAEHGLIEQGSDGQWITTSAGLLLLEKKEELSVH